MKPYNPDLIPRARSMRKVMTNAERRLWFECLRSAPYKFRRQRPIGTYVVDFYAPDLRLVIEADGGGHFEDLQIHYDRLRTEFLEGCGLRVLRFTNDEIFHQIDDVRMRIFAEFELRTALASPMQ